MLSSLRLAEASVKDNLLFQGLTAQALTAIIDSMHPVVYEAGTEIIRQGDNSASEFYILEAGSADVIMQRIEWPTPRKLLTYGPGRCEAA